MVAKIYERDISGGGPDLRRGIDGVLTQYQARNQGIASRMLRAAARIDGSHGQPHRSIGPIGRGLSLLCKNHGQLD